MPSEWTLDDLVTRVEAALTAAEYPGAPNGRVREVPDRRAIRWYTTIGLLDRPAAMRGRTALYGPRHLAQLVAIKHRQAQGHSLAEIQAELVGASDEALSEIARMPLATPAPAPPASGLRSEATREDADWTGPAAARAEASASNTARRAFWAQPAGVVQPPGTSEAQGLLYGVPLAGGAVLMVPAAPDHDDVAAVRAAARPLLDLLAQRGLLSRRSST